jgi:tryptophan halogenase
MEPIRRVLVLGGGSAGFLAAITLKTRLPDLPVTVLRSPDIGIIGVGEGTTAGIPRLLHGYLGVDLKEFFREAEPLWKLGLRLIWGPRPFFDYCFTPQMDLRYTALTRPTGFYCTDPDWSNVGIGTGLMSFDNVFLRGPNGLPITTQDFAYHIENAKFVGWLDGHARRLGVTVIDDTVTNVRQDEHGITGLDLASGGSADADLYVDSSGFASRLLGKALGEPFVSYKPTLFCDRAVVGGWDRGPDDPVKPYTTAETMAAGWAWQIEHEFRVNRGYVFGSAFLSDDDAEAEFRAKNSKVGPTRVVKFVTGRYERQWVKNVAAIGNASGFVEPLEATSLSTLADHSVSLAETIADSDRRPRDSHKAQFNLRCGRMWDAIRAFLAVHYRFNRRYDTPFWRACLADVELGAAAELIEYYQDNGPELTWRSTLLPPHDSFGMEGYLSLLVGQAVPHAHGPTIPEKEWATWRRIRGVIGEQTRRGFSTADALKLVRSDAWNWPANLFPRGPVAPFQPSATIPTRFD